MLNQFRASKKINAHDDCGHASILSLGGKNVKGTKNINSS